MKTAIEKMVEWCWETMQDGLRLGFVDAAGVYEECLDKARSLAEEEAKSKPTAPASLMEELADLEHRRWSSWQTWCHKVLREYESKLLGDERLKDAVEAWLDFVNKQLDDGKFPIDSNNTYELAEILSHHPSDPVEQDPEECGFTLATCPYERSSGITISAEELAEFKAWKASARAKAEKL